ncbi:hypothetical protein Tco_0510671 [Tanacetum coccineum]
MAQLKYCDKHNQVGFLRKPDESAGFAEIVDFLRGSNLRYALTTNPTIHDSLVKQFWQTATAKTLANGTLELHATIDTIAYTITEASIRNKLQLADASGITMLPNNEIFEGMGAYGIFGNMKRGFRGVPRPLLPAMLSIANPSAGQEVPSVTQPQLSSSMGRKFHDLDPLVYLLQELVTPSKTPSKTVNASREEQVEDISPTTLEAAAILTKVKKIKLCKKDGELVNQRRKHFAEERSRSKRDKPMTQTQLRNYMSNFLKNQGTWKLTQLKKLNFEEVKAEFEKLVKQLDTYVPINFEATKESLKRFEEKGEKRLKDVEAKDDEPTKKSGKRRKQMARKGMHTSVDKNDSEDSDDVGEQEESDTGTKTPINPVPVAMKTPSVATYKIIKQGEKGVYQIVREDGTDIVYINFGAMLKSISRDDLTELYRIVMNRYGMDGPEDKLEKGFWKCLRTMFEEPLSTDPILNVLDKKLQGGKPDEDCYKMLKMMEKQAGAKGLTSPEQTATGVNTPGSDENRLKLYVLMYNIVKVADTRVKD